jgi:hypothetical protein
MAVHYRDDRVLDFVPPWQAAGAVAILESSRATATYFYLSSDLPAARMMKRAILPGSASIAT